MAFAEREWAPLEREAVLRLKVQLLVPEALEKLPPSTATCTELMLTESEAVPEMLMEPETVAPLTGEVMATEGAGVATLMLKFLEADCAAASFTCTVKEKVPATEGVPETEPPAFKARPLDSVPLARLQV